MESFSLNSVSSSKRVKYLLAITFIVFGITNNIASLAEAPHAFVTVTGIVSLGAFIGATALFRRRPGLFEQDA